MVDYDPRCCGSFCSHLSYEEDHEVLKDACVLLSKRDIGRKCGYHLISELVCVCVFCIRFTSSV